VAAVDESFLLGSRNFQDMFSDCQCYVVALNCTFCIHEVHLRRSDESCNEQVARCIVKVLRCIYLLYNTILHNDDSCTKGHSLCLVMCYVDDRSAKAFMKLGNLDTHLDSQFCIQV